MDNRAFFTLSELQELLKVEQRRSLNDSLLKKGVPHIVVGRETFFVTESFVAWLKANEKRRGEGQ